MCSAPVRMPGEPTVEGTPERSTYRASLNKVCGKIKVLSEDVVVSVQNWFGKKGPYLF